MVVLKIKDTVLKIKIKTYGHGGTPRLVSCVGAHLRLAAERDPAGEEGECRKGGLSRQLFSSKLTEGEGAVTALHAALSPLHAHGYYHPCVCVLERVGLRSCVLVDVCWQ